MATAGSPERRASKVAPHGGRRQDNRRPVMATVGRRASATPSTTLGLGVEVSVRMLMRSPMRCGPPSLPS